MRDFILIGCISLMSGNAVANITGSCIYSPEGFTTCWEYSGFAESAAPQLERGCEERSAEGHSGQWNNGVACSTENRIGRCELTPQTSESEIINFYEPTSVDEAQMMCELSDGRWLP